MGLGTAQLASLLGKELPKVFRYVAKSIGNPEKFPPLGPIDLAKKFKTTATPKTIYKYSQDKSFLKDLGLNTRLNYFDNIKLGAAVKKRPATGGVKYTTEERKVLDTQRELQRRRDNPEASRLRRLKERTSPAGIAAQKRYRDKAFRERGKREYGRTPKDNLIYDFTRSADATNGRLKYVKSSLPKDGRFTRAATKKLKFKDTETGEIIDYKNVKNFYEKTFGPGSYELALKPMRQYDLVRGTLIKNESDRLTGAIQRAIYKDKFNDIVPHDISNYMKLATFNRHHKEGVAKNPFFSELTSAEGNRQINYLETIYGSKLQNAINNGAGIGQQKKIIQEFTDVMSQDPTAMKLFNKEYGYMPYIPGGGESVGIVGGAKAGRQIGTLKDTLLETARFAKVGRQVNPSVRKMEIPEELMKDGGRVKKFMGGYINPEDIEAEIEMAEQTDGEILSQKEAIERIVERFTNNFKEGGLAREKFQVGGAVGGPVGGGAGGPVGGGFSGGVGNSKVGNIQAVLAGIAAGVIDIPKGAFSLGASLMDLGLGTVSYTHLTLPTNREV